MGKIVLVPTPMGNLEDITLRALRILNESDLILAEDTRTTGVLLKHYDISTSMVSYHQHNEHSKTERLLAGMGADTVYAMVTDAGTPGISDPGFFIVREALRKGHRIECLPGPAAFVPALAASGLSSDRFHFEGFLPHKKGRNSRLRFLADYPHTVILYESPHRVLRSLEQLSESFGPNRRAVVARELTKIHEEFVRGTLADLVSHFQKAEARGEMVLLIEGKS